MFVDNRKRMPIVRGDERWTVTVVVVLRPVAYPIRARSAVPDNRSPSVRVYMHEINSFLIDNTYYRFI